MSNILKKSLVSTSVAVALVMTLTACGSSDTSSPASVETRSVLTGVDTLLTTIVTKSSVSGALVKDENNSLARDTNGNFMFDYTGPVTTVIINEATGVVSSSSAPIGTVTGQAGFPQEFANLAFAAYAYASDLTGTTPLPAFPAKIDWKCNACELVIAGTTYKSTKSLDTNASSNMALMDMNPTSYTGLGPVEFGKLLDGTTGKEGLSMTVRTGGCGAVVGVDGPNAGKMGTLCLNGSFTFDLSKIILSADPAEMMKSDLPGTGNSNCTLVLQTPMKM